MLIFVKKNHKHLIIFKIQSKFFDKFSGNNRFNFIIEKN